MGESVLPLTRQLAADDATRLIGTPVGVDLEPTARSPRRDGDVIRLVDGGTTVALITRLPGDLRAGLRGLVTTYNYGASHVARGSASRERISQRGATFGYAPRKPSILQEGCRTTKLSRDTPGADLLLNRVAGHLTDLFRDLDPEQAQHDREVLESSVLNDWRMGDSLWTSGVINQANVLPYHRDGNNLETWSAMPTLRYKMAGGHLHLPEYGVVFPCGDGDVTWFYGRGLVHGVTPMWRRADDGYRYSLVFYALKGMKDCATYAEETTRVAARRTERERAAVDRIRATVGVPTDASATPPLTGDE